MFLKLDWKNNRTNKFLQTPDLTQLDVNNHYSHRTALRIYSTNIFIDALKRNRGISNTNKRALL